MTDELPPYSLVDEAAVIGCCLQDSQLVAIECAKVDEGCFYDQRHKIVWNAIQELSKANSVVDQITITRKLKESGHDDTVTQYLPELYNASPSPANINYYLPTLFDYSLKRRVIRGCAKLSRIAMNGVTGTELMAKMEQFLGIERPNEIKVLTGDDAGMRMIDDLERRHTLQGRHSGIDTGFYHLDNMLDGLQYGEQTLIGARPSKGKTALGLGIFKKVCMMDKIPALFVSMEMSTTALMRRMLSSHCEIPMNDVRRGSYSDEIFRKITTFRAATRKLPMHILDAVTGITITELCAQVRRQVRKHGIKLVVVDYLQKIKPDTKHEKRTYEVAEVSGKLRALAVETNAAFLTLAQLNREGEKDKGRAPRLSDLGDSGQIERDADTVILIHHVDNGVNLIVAKQRDGETGVAKVHFNGTFCRFENPETETPTNPYND